MPIYAFACDACGHAFDRLQKLSDADPSECSACGAAAIRRQLTAPQFRLAGGGWYETDFKKDGDSKRNLAGEGGEGAKPAPEVTPSSAGGTDSATPATKPAPTTPEPAKPGAAKSAPVKPAANP